MDGAPGKPTAQLSETLRDPAACGSDSVHGQLTKRRIDVLLRFETKRDMDIAEELNLTYDGLRYRANRKFKKLGARSRLDAVHRAREMGILPSAKP